MMTRAESEEEAVEGETPMSSRNDWTPGMVGRWVEVVAVVFRDEGLVGAGVRLCCEITSV